MTTLLDHLDSRPAPSLTGNSVHQSTTPAQRLRATMAAVRVSFTWLGTQKTLTREQSAQAAEAFDAEGQYLSAGKKLIDTSHSAFRAVTAIRGKVDVFWKGQSLPFPEPGVRLIKHDVVESFASSDDGLPHRARRRRGQPGPALRRTEAGGPRTPGIAVQPVRLSRRPSSASLAWNGVFPASSHRNISSNLVAGTVRGRAGPGLGPVRGSRPACRAGVPR